MDENGSQQKKTTAVLETIRETVLQSKIHGLSNLVRVSSRIMKTIWFFCFFTAMAYCTYQIILALIVYMKFEGMNKFMFLHKIIIIVIASNLLLF
jgi:hypothetical protein